MKRLFKVLRRYFALVGIAAHVAALAVVIFVLQTRGYTLSDLLLRIADKQDLAGSAVVEALSPSDQYKDHKLDGNIRLGHPRILMPELEGRTPGPDSPIAVGRYGAYQNAGIRSPAVPCGGEDYVANGICWHATGDTSVAYQALAKLKNVEIPRVTAVGGANIGTHAALGYDLLHDFSGFDSASRQLIEEKLRAALRETLRALDGNSASLWHGRSSLAAQAWLLAVVLDSEEPDVRDLVRRAQGHFLQTIDALAATEGWPEGYNYWINNRAYLIALAGAAYINGLEGAARVGDVKLALERTGLWHIYGTRPDHKFEPLGDEGPRRDLKDETRRPIDIIAGLTNSGPLSAYSRYLDELHGGESYYRGYRWGFGLMNDPAVAPSFVPKGANLAPMSNYLPLAERFGAGYLDQVFIRSGWGPDDTFISFRAGRTLTHHGHYDAGHFSLFKGAPLAVNSSLYGDYMGENRLNYAIRTVAKNSLLVLRPEEEVLPNRQFKDSVAAGGQRITMPTGSAVVSLDDFRDNLDAGEHFEGAKINEFRLEPGAFAYVSSDLTGAYNNSRFDETGGDGKVRNIAREMLYLFGPDILIIRDQLRLSNRDYTAKWLLHTTGRPEASGLEVLKGTLDDGISQTTAGEALVANGRGSLVLQKLRPAGGLMRLVGGPSHRFYVEVDGEDSDLDGRDMAAGSGSTKFFDRSDWRIELQAAEPSASVEFVTALLPSVDGARRERVRELSSSDPAAVVLSTGATVVVLFPESGYGSGGGLSFLMPIESRRLIVASLTGAEQINLISGDAEQMLGVNNATAVAGVQKFAGGRVSIRVP